MEHAIYKRDVPSMWDIYPLVFIVFNAEMTNVSYLTIFLDHTSASTHRIRDYLVLEKYRFRRLSSSRSATTRGDIRY